MNRRSEILLVGIAGIVYNSAMQIAFGDYRFSHTIEAIHGHEPWWLERLHSDYEEFQSWF